MSIKIVSGLIFTAGLTLAETSATFWRFEGGSASGGELRAFEKGVPPGSDPDVPSSIVWDGCACASLSEPNGASMRFRTPDEAKGAAPVGGEIAVTGKGAALKPASFTVEAFVKIAKSTGRHALVASKRRNGQTGSSWSLSLTPQGALSVRFDTEREKDGKREGVFNQCFVGARLPDDGTWHHVALAFDGAARKATLFLDYQVCGGGTVASDLVYDDSDLVLGRGLDGWLDEVRLTPDALHPEQFLRTVRFFSEMKPKKAPALALLDQTPTRVQSALKPDLERIGTLKPKSVSEIETPMWSLGCETLDRDLADWDAYRNYLVPLGIKRIRLQGGWNRTEKKKGEYDFAWLDHIVDDAHKLGLSVCLETSYNNRLYEPGGATGPGGLLPEGDETLAAWDRWVEAMVRHYSAKGVKEWMMYNEPNLRKENTAEKVVANNVRTAAIIKRIDPQAKVGAFVLAGLNVEMMRKMLASIGEQGQLDLFDWAIYHGYSGNPDRLNERMDEFNALLAEVAPRLRPWQGEAGCASEEVQYALSGIDWTEYSHAKWNTRRMLCDIGHDVESSVFCISDLSYSKDFISRYGLLKTNPDNSIIKVKSAYYAVQNVVSVFNGALQHVKEYDLKLSGTEKALTWFAFRDKASGLDVVTLWDGTEIPGNGSDLETVGMTVKGGHFKEPVWVDLVTGNLYAIPPDRFRAEGDTVTFTDVPVYDGPVAITDKSLLSFEPARVKKASKATKKPPAKQTLAAAARTQSPVVQHLLPGTQQPAPLVLVLGDDEAKAGEALKWLNGQSVHACFLKVDLSSAEEALQKIREALGYIRGRMSEWQVREGAVGVLGRADCGALVEKLCGQGADFAVRLDVPVGGERSTPKLFAHTSDGWQTPLAAWLETFKGRVF